MMKIYLKSMKKYGKKISSIKNKESTKKSTYKSSNNAYINLKTKEYGDWINYFYNKKLSKVNIRYKCLALIMLESTSMVEGNKYYLQTFIYDCEYGLKNDLKNINRKKL